MFNYVCFQSSFFINAFKVSLRGHRSSDTGNAASVIVLLDAGTRCRFECFVAG